MEAAVVSALLRTLAPKIFSLLQENHRLQRNLEGDIQYIRGELRMIAAAIEDHDQQLLMNNGAGTGDVQRLWIEAVRELAYGIEDSIDRFLHRVAGEPDASSLRQRAHRLQTTATRNSFAAEIREHRRKSEEISKLRDRYTGGGGGGGPSNTSMASPAAASNFPASSDTADTPAADLVGMEGPLSEILELMQQTDEGQPGKLKVISIVGFGGLGKTVLARRAFNLAAAGEQYEPCIWVRASDKGASSVLKEILVESGVKDHDSDTSDLSKLITSVRNCLEHKRFFIVIDDMRTEFWNTIKNAFPADTDSGSRLMVTTAIHSIANACSSAMNGHVYLMRTLDEKHARQLFCKEAYLEPEYCESESAAEALLKKCDGLPLALVTTAQLLQSKNQLTSKGCANLCRRMGEHVEKEETLVRMKYVLNHNYNSLPGHILKACFLYLGIFPNDHSVRRNCLIRRWLAEGFVEADHQRSALDVAIDSFDNLMNRSIIHPIDKGNNTEAKTVQTHGMMLEFARHKSICENFITFPYNQARLPDKIRRLSLHCSRSSTEAGTKPGTDFSLVRSLTVFGEINQDVLKFRKFELLRVLDLEEFEALTDEHLKRICNLLMLLRYLSLGGNIKKLPKEISKLKFLETLDTRRAKAKIIPIPMEVIMLPCLVHLLGMFRLPDVGPQMSKLNTCLLERSAMETLAGVLADKSLAFPALMSHIKSLKKVKVGCESTTDGGNGFAHLSRPIQEFIQRSTDVNDAHSLSLDFEGCSQNFLDFHLEESSCYLNSLKLHGKICSLPPFVKQLAGITELCVSSSGHLIGENFVASLANLRSLHYLKLIGDHLDRFLIEQGAFRSLRSLCIVVNSISSLENKEGALPHLESLWLLCKDLDGLCGTRIEWLRRLKEVTLNDGVSDETRKRWNEAARNHQRQPRVLLLKPSSKEFNGMQNSECEPMEIYNSPATATTDIVQMQYNKGESSTTHKKPSEKLGRLIFGSRKADELLSKKREANELCSNKKASDSTSTEITCVVNGCYSVTATKRGW